MDIFIFSGDHNGTAPVIMKAVTSCKGDRIRERSGFVVAMFIGATSTRHELLTS